MKILEKDNKNLQIMLKLCEDEKKQNNELNDYELKLKTAETKKIINRMK